MAVLNTFTLPGQPAQGAGLGGVATFTPLGGDGYTAPRGMFTVTNMVSTGDATGGAHSNEIVMDSRYCSMVSYASMTGPNAADIDIRWSLVASVGGVVPLMVRTLAVDRMGAAIDAATINDLWLPPAFIMPGSDPATLRIAVINADTITMQLHAVIFIYNINARQKVPYGMLTAPRGGI